MGHADAHAHLAVVAANKAKTAASGAFEESVAECLYEITNALQGVTNEIGEMHNIVVHNELPGSK